MIEHDRAHHYGGTIIPRPSSQFLKEKTEPKKNSIQGKEIRKPNRAMTASTIEILNLLLMTIERNLNKCKQ